MALFGVIARRGGAWLPLIATTALTGTAGKLALPAVLGHLVDSLVAGPGSGGGAGGGATGRWLALAGGLIAVSVAVDLLDVFAATACVAATTAWLRLWLIRQLLAVDPPTFARFDAGDLVSRLAGNAADAAQAGPSAVLVGVAVLPPAGSLVLLALIDPWLAGAFLGGVLLVALVLRAFTRQTANAMMHYQQAQGRIAARLAESLSGARTIAAAGTAPREVQRILVSLPELHRHGRLTWRVLSRASAQAAVVGPLVQVAVLATGGLALVHGRITAGELFAASQYALIGAGLGSLTGVLSRLARARSGVRRAEEVLTAAALHYGTRRLPAGPGRMEFRGVTVQAAAEDDPDRTALLAGVDLVLPGGAAVAVVGRSGAGKSVLAALAARLRQPDAGEVLLDGVPLHELRRDELRAAVGCAFERPVLVGDTVGDAVALGRDRAQVQAAMRATYAHDFVTRLPHGYDTPLVDAPMSGGEAQRLGLARAWGARRVLVLDDATSSLDMVTEMQISRALTGDHGGRTRLIVTHRPSTAARADLVAWLDAGRLRAVGPHALLWQDPAYRAVFQ